MQGMLVRYGVAISVVWNIDDPSYVPSNLCVFEYVFGLSERVLCNHPCPSMVSLSIHSSSVHLLVCPFVGPSFL